MMTEKQMEESLNRIWFHFEKLQNALNDAHNRGLIKYTNYQEDSPCEALAETRNRFKRVTKDQIAEIIQKKFRRRHW